MATWLRRAALALLVLALAAFGIAWLALRGSLPALDGQAALGGLHARATIRRDAIGVATIDAADRIDAMRALGWVHAQERFFEMDLMRRVAAGELAELFGERALKVDRAHRRDRLRARARTGLATLPAEQRALLAAYTDGVNAGLAALHTRPWPYALLRQAPRPWRVEDTPLVGYAMYYDLQDATGSRELAMSQVAPHLPPALLALLRHDGSSWDAPLQGAARGDATLPGPDEVDLRRWAAPARRMRRIEERHEVGSNNFAVGAAATGDGRAILANDMHLGLRVPNIWFRARLRYADARAPGGRVDVTGFSLPGMPGVIVGSNTHVAWGFTNSYGDWLDWIRVPDCRPTRCRGSVVHREPLGVARGDTVALDVVDTPWGPVDRYLPDGSALVRRWVAHLPGSLNMGLLDMPRAASLDDALRVADHTAIPAQNLLLADREGHIAWRLLGPMPQRGPGCVADGVSDARHCAPWPVATAGNPRIVDPADGRLWTANARVVDGADLARIGDGGYVVAVRARMIRDDLRAKRTLDERALAAIQLDDRSIFLQRWARLLHERAAASPATSPLRRLDVGPLEARADADAVAYRLVRAWRAAVLDRVREGLLVPARVALGADAAMPEIPQLEGIAWPLVTRRPAHLLDPRFESWDALFADAAGEVLRDLGARKALRLRTWGERNTAAICHPLAAALPLGRRLLCMPAEPLDGDSLTPRAQSPDFGASERMVVSPGHEAMGITHMPGGQSGHPLSPFWGAGHADWVHGRATPFLPGRTRHSLMLTPASH